MLMNQNTNTNMYTTKVEQKLTQLSNKQLLQLVQEMKQTSVPADALIREVIKDTELDTSLPLLAFVSVGQLTAHVLADRLASALDDLNLYERNGYDISELREIDAERNRD